MIKVREVERVKEVKIYDGYYFASFIYDSDAGKVKTISRGAYRSRMHEPVFIPKAIFSSFVKRAYAVFYNSNKKRVICKCQLKLKLGV